jgi:hypothetical protein
MRRWAKEATQAPSGSLAAVPSEWAKGIQLKGVLCIDALS